MNNTPHTCGPWKASTCILNGRIHINAPNPKAVNPNGNEADPFGDGELYIATVYIEPSQGNARLIAKSPELLDMLEAVLWQTQNVPKNADDLAARTYTLANAHTLIAEAKGYAYSVAECTQTSADSDFRALALQARVDQLEAERVAANEKECADRDSRSVHHPAARALIEDGLREMCGTLPPHEIDWEGSGRLVGATVRIGDISLRASFHCPTASVAPESVRFTYNCYYVITLADLGKLIQQEEVEEESN